MRGVASWKLPQASKDVLDDIPLVGSATASKKFLLGDLAAHRGSTVDVLIESSVESYLARSNYNNTKDISNLLESVGVEVSKVNGRFPSLEELMQRRHQIVHRADRQTEVLGSGDHVVRSLNKVTVRWWAAEVKAFGADLLAQL